MAVRSEAGKARAETDPCDDERMTRGRVPAGEAARPTGRSRTTRRHGPSSHPTARSLADDLRRRTDDQLVALLLARPDLARPAPADLVALAARATTRTSVHRALERLDRGLLQTVEAVLVASGTEADDPVRTEDVAELLGADPRDALDRLWELALLWWSPAGPRPVRALAEIIGPHPGGLGIGAAEVPTRYAASSPPSPASLPEVLADAPLAARAIVDTLTWGPPIGAVPPAGPAHAGAAWLVDHGLCAPSGIGHVALVREVALALRGGRIHRQPQLTPPDLDCASVDPVAVDRVASASARDLLDHLDLLGDLWTASPPRVLRSGALGVRELNALARALDLEVPQAAWLVEVATAAGLIADDRELTAAFVPTPEFDGWRGRSAGARWAAVAQAWWDSPRAAYLVGTPAAAGGTVAALGPEAHRPAVRAVRASLLGELAGLPAGTAPTRPALLARLQWRRPLVDPAALGTDVTGLLREADWLGATALGAQSALGRALAQGPDQSTLSAAASDAIPAAVDHVLLQADLTAIAPGPLDGALGAFMRLVSDVESRGGATVLRFSPESVRRALDDGMTADEVLDRLREASRTPLPQPLDYLVRDVSRRHGQTRVGGATAYIRSDDEAILAALLADRALSGALLRRIAPTVLVSAADPGTLVDLLRAGGYAPALEAFDGTVVVARPQLPRARPRGTTRANPEPALAPVDDPFVRTVVSAVRAAPARPVAGAAPHGTLSSSPAETNAMLRQAVSDALAVWIGYADSNGRTARHLVRPVRIEGGRVYAVSGESDAEQVYLMHRITGVSGA